MLISGCRGLSVRCLRVKFIHTSVDLSTPPGARLFLSNISCYGIDGKLDFAHDGASFSRVNDRRHPSRQPVSLVSTPGSLPLLSYAGRKQASELN